MFNRYFSVTSALTPAQWLPKPATCQVPSTQPALRAPWSPQERVKRFQQ